MHSFHSFNTAPLRPSGTLGGMWRLGTCRVVPALMTPVTLASFCPPPIPLAIAGLCLPQGSIWHSKTCWTHRPPTQQSASISLSSSTAHKCAFQLLFSQPLSPGTIRSHIAPNSISQSYTSVTLTTGKVQVAIWWGETRVISYILVRLDSKGTSAFSLFFFWLCDLYHSLKRPFILNIYRWCPFCSLLYILSSVNLTWP